MATTKAHTDLEQSKKLAKILPLESADMVTFPFDEDKLRTVFANDFSVTGLPDETPAWSLAALLSVLRIFTTPTAFSVKISAPTLIKTENGYDLTYTGDYTPMINNGSDVEAPIESIADNPVDACVEMILKLHELNLL